MPLHCDHRVPHRNRPDPAATTPTPPPTRSTTHVDPAWNRAGTVVSTASVTAAETSTSPVHRRAHIHHRIHPPMPQTGSTPPTIPRHSPSSATRPGARAAATNPCAHRRIDVPTGANPRLATRRHPAHAAARSGTTIRHDTPSTTR